MNRPACLVILTRSLAIALVSAVLASGCGSSESRAFIHGTPEYYVHTWLVNSLLTYAPIAKDYLYDNSDSFKQHHDSAELSVWYVCEEAKFLKDSRERNIFLDACDKFKKLDDAIMDVAFLHHPMPSGGIAAQWPPAIIDEMNNALLEPNE